MPPVLSALPLRPRSPGREILTACGPTQAGQAPTGPIPCPANTVPAPSTPHTGRRPRLPAAHPATITHVQFRSGPDVAWRFRYSIGRCVFTATIRRSALRWMRRPYVVLFLMPCRRTLLRQTQRPGLVPISSLRRPYPPRSACGICLDLSRRNNRSGRTGSNDYASRVRPRRL